ncbi:Exo-beta-D-glucosaminidase precursor [Aquisphaera giovannonii]|uniref:Beta-mannosidase B n=1 Tax=Aquisphaera giovannonii TaxID=406548 RepID=A0A5B9W124_9BACT|nr:glycoside hydrolase family 2 protein [Aquisphaera giovannonii]QEH33969.1 Exo-beta-D-glucosaminidase precursor [Aquisphaera giovannonii]
MKSPARWASAILMGAVLLSVAQARAGGPSRLDLGGAWQVVQEGSRDPIPARVPGVIHTDLLAAGQIPDPFYRNNERAVQWVGEASWIYGRSFDVPADLLNRQHVLLRCEGLDTLATIKLNGAEVARADNMFRTYEFDVKSKLKPGANQIEIRFDSVLPSIREKEALRKLPTWAYPGSAYVRKEPCNFGWDWGPTLITCGIWRPIGLVSFDAARLDDVAILQDHSQPGKVALTVTAATSPAPPPGAAAKVTVRLGSQDVASSSAPVREGKAKVGLDVADPKLWWPAGMGAQPLYDVRVELLDAAGRVLDASGRRIGLRTLRAVEQSEKETMHLVVNGVPFFAKGANWIPPDSFATRPTREVLRRYAADAVAANMNCLRFWGGGYYEDDDLFDACDEMGICVWMDFKFGCTTYPSFDPAFLENVRQEARDNLRRLRHHPSIALWCGNNEIMFFRGKAEWTKEKMSEGDYYKLFRDLLGEQVRELAPQTDYVTGSPDCGDVHFWEVWHGGKPFEAYRNIHGFVSEFGFQSFPVPSTVEAFTAPSDRDSVYSPAMKYHMRSNRMYMNVAEDGTVGTDKIMVIVKKYFRDPKDFESTLWLSQITQAYGIKYGAEGWRREMPKSMGCVYWQYNDTWPCTSWSSVDYFGRWKALHYLARRFYAPVLVSGVEDPKAGKVDIHVTSDRMSDCRGQLTWTVTDLVGKPLASGSSRVDIPARASRLSQSVSLRDLLQTHAPQDLLVWLKLDVDALTVSENLVTLTYPRDLELLDPRLSSKVAEHDGHFRVTLHAAHPALWTWLEFDGVDARLSDNFVHVMSDRPVTIEVTPARPMSKEAFQAALRIRSLYDTSAH